MTLIALCATRNFFSSLLLGRGSYFLLFVQKKVAQEKETLFLPPRFMLPYFWLAFLLLRGCPNFYLMCYLSTRDDPTFHPKLLGV